MAGATTKSKSVIFHPRNLVVLLALVILFFLRWKGILSHWSILIVFMAALIVYYLIMPALAKKRLAEFEKQLSILHLKGKSKEALAFYKRHLFMRAFGPPGDMKKLLGQCHAFLFNWESARNAFKASLDASGSALDIATAAGYGEACFHTGYDREAERVMKSDTLKKIHLPHAAYYFMHLFLEDEKKIKGAMEKFEKIAWDEEKDRPVRLLTLAEIQAEDSKLSAAAESLAEVERKKLPAPLRPMARLLEARILLLQGKKKKAEKIITELSRQSTAGRHVIEVEDFEEAFKEEKSKS